MRGIFIRIYLAFVVTSLAAAVVTIVLAMYYRQWSNDSVNLIAPTGGYISAAELMLQRGGEPLLLEWLHTFARHPSVNAYIFDDSGVSLITPVPTTVQEYAYAADSYQAQINWLSQTEILVKSPIAAADGRIYLLVVEFIHPLKVFNLPAYIGWGILASLAIFAVWGFLLSRYLTKPLLSLQRSVRSIAQGEWPVYISKRVLKRKDEVGELGREFASMAKRLHRSLAEQKQLLSDVSHELRSPLARSRVALELARLDALPEQQEYLERMELENQRLDTLIEDLLNLARLDARKDEEHWQRLDAVALLAQVVADAHFEYAQGSLNFIPAAKPIWVMGDERLLLSAFENIIRNALIHTAANTTVEVKVVSSYQVRISIRDYGKGVPKAMLKDLLKPFVRVESARQRSVISLQQGHRGFGLGLTLALRIIHFHHGRLVLKNAQGGGLAVVMTLPKG